MIDDAKQSLRVVVIGLGYVGLTLSVALAQRGISVIGLERREDVVRLVMDGLPHFSENGLTQALGEVVSSGHLVATTTLKDFPAAGIYIITVGTPLNENGTPRIDMIENATTEAAEHMADGALVILRSTVKIGTTRSVVAPILAQSSKQSYLAMCPERTLEGDALRELANLPQIIGGLTEAAADRAAAIFSRLTHTIVRVDDPETAEMIKLVDNTYRDVKFAFGNEVARACDGLGISAHSVISAGKLGYSRTDVANPGLVGGPCLEKDPHILQHSLLSVGVSLEMTSAARLINERQPAETVSRMIELATSSAGKQQLRVAILGLAFKGVPETDDLRGSMSLHVVKELLASGIVEELRAFDPVVSRSALEALPFSLTVSDSLTLAVDGADLVVIANNHPSFRSVPLDTFYQLMPSTGIIYDYWNNLGHETLTKRRGRYFSVGHAARKETK
jgi:UDP-N-acetyl-D-mannosaminuronic acid dehydrogenase